MKNSCQSSQNLLGLYCVLQLHLHKLRGSFQPVNGSAFFGRAGLKPVNVDNLMSLYVWHSLGLLDKTTAVGKQRTEKGNRFVSFHIDLMNDDNPVEVVKSVFSMTRTVKAMNNWIER